MRSLPLLLLVATFGIIAAPPSANAQDWGVRRPHRTLLVPHVAPQPVQVVVTPPATRVIRTRVVIRDPQPTTLELRPEERIQTAGPRWYLGAGMGALLRFGDETSATPSYRFDAGILAGSAEFSLRFDLAPGFDERASLYTAGAGFGYRFLEGSRVRPVLGVGLETIFYNPQEEDTQRAFAATGRGAVELDVPTRFGNLAIGLDATIHQPIAGSESAMRRLLGIGAHIHLVF